MRIAVDVMGGDHAPDEIIRGSFDALDLLGDDDRLILVGDEEAVADIAEDRGLRDPRIEVVHTTLTIGMDESPVEAVRTKAESSLVRSITLGSARKTDDPVDVVISAGNTGACVSAATMIMKRLRGVHRPGICTAVPTLYGPVVLCDVGANPEPRVAHLAQYALMAEVYARRVLGKESPRIGLMNIGAEDSKGTEIVREARKRILNVSDLNYIGFVEGRDVFEGKTDIVVTDGFVGNTLLKLAESLASSLIKALIGEIMAQDPGLAQSLQPILEDMYRKNDYHEYGGAPLLGVNGGCVICHGSSKAKTIRSAIKNARDIVRANINDLIVERVGQLSETGAGHEEAA